MTGVLLTFFLFALSGIALGQSVEPAQEMDSFVKALNHITTGQKITGNVLVARNGEIVFQKGYGKADYAGDVAFTVDTPFLIASLSKPITAIAVAQLCEEGRLNYSDPLSKYFPDQLRGSEITIHHLLTHTSGILPNPPVNLFSPITLDRLVNAIGRRWLEFDPGSAYKYSNSGFSLLASIIGQVSGLSYGEYVKQRIFEPLGMTRSGCAAGIEQVPNIAKGYRVVNSGLHEVGSWALDLSVFIGAGSIYSTTNDLLKLAESLSTDKLLAKESIDNMLANGYGWGVTDFNGSLISLHNGRLDNGYTSTLIRYLEEDLIVIVLLNASNDGLINLNVAQTLAAISMGEDYIMPQEVSAIQLSEEELERFEGQFELADGQKMTVMRMNPVLVLGPHRPYQTLVPYSATGFFVNGSEYKRIEFIGDDQGQISGLVYRESAVQFGAVRAE